MKKDKIKIKKDILLITVIVMIALVFFLFIHFFIKKDGSMVVIKINGDINYKGSLYQSKELVVDGYQGGSNRIVIQDGFVYMADADCPDKLCEHMGKISKTGENIVCMPHRVVVEIVGDGSELDSVVK
ncbi:MAG: NusG domain II-containing protein [Lachnospira sp.]|jgi:hypothetical protein|nr:NusG domain II-containing protein [Lachnospira sp.]